MWTVENRGSYDRGGLRYPSDVTDDAGISEGEIDVSLLHQGVAAATAGEVVDTGATGKPVVAGACRSECWRRYRR